MVYEKIGDIFRYGNGVEQNNATALKWYLDGVEIMSGREPASFSREYFQKSRLYRKIGDMYAKGLGTKKSQASARKWYRKADRSKTAFECDVDDFDFPKKELDFEFDIKVDSRGLPEIEIQRR